MDTRCLARINDQVRVCYISCAGFEALRLRDSGRPQLESTSTNIAREPNLYRRPPRPSVTKTIEFARSSFGEPRMDVLALKAPRELDVCGRYDLAGSIRGALKAPVEIGVRNHLSGRRRTPFGEIFGGVCV